MQQFFIDLDFNVCQTIELEKNILHHIETVLRKKDGYIFRVVNKQNKIFEAILENKSAKILKELDEYNELNVDITVILSIIKKDKFDYCIQKLAELGVNKIVPIYTKFTNISKNNFSFKLDRYKKILLSASEQSHRNKICEIVEPITLKEIKNYISEINIVAYEKESKPFIINKAKTYTVLIGPEGGLDIDEINYLNDLNFNSIRLTKQILRSETAATFIVSNIVGDNL